MSELNIKVRKSQDNGSTFRATPDTLYMGGVGSAKVDTLHFEVPEEWAGCAITLHVQRLSGALPDPQMLDENNCVVVDRRWTQEKQGSWMLLAVDENGYIAMTKPGQYTCYETIDTNSTTETITPSVYEQFVADVKKWGQTAVDAAAKAKSSEEKAAGSASASAGSAAAAAQSQSAAAGSATEAAGSANAAEESKTAAATSESNAAKHEEAAKKASDEAGAKAGTDKTLSIENAPADAAAVRKLIKESLAAQRAEDYARIKFWASNDPTSPASFIGGTWERVEGKFIIGASSAYPVGTTGGSATHTQTVAEMPSHNHSGSTGSAGSHSHSGSTGSAGSHSHSGSTGGAGGHSHTVSAMTAIAKYSFASSDENKSAGQYGNAGTPTTSRVGDHTHTVSISSAGAHTHTVSIGSAGTHTHTVSIGSTGSGHAMSILNPYYALYLWQRVA